MSYVFKDGNGNPQTGRSFLAGGQHAPAHTIVDSGGTEVEPATAGQQATAQASLTAITSAIGTAADTTASSDSGSFSLIALTKRLLGKLPVSLGRKASAGALAVTLASDEKTYRAFVSSGTATAATDFLTLTGSASKTVRVKKLRVQGYHSAATTMGLSIIRRSAANTGGTSSNPSAAKADSTNAAATAVVTAYTANPSALGTSAGVIDGTLLTVGTTTPAFTAGCFDVEYGKNGAQEIVLRGTSELLAVNFGATTITGAFVMIEWTEE